MASVIGSALKSLQLRGKGHNNNNNNRSEDMSGLDSAKGLDYDDFDDYPPGHVRNVVFWIWHGLCWTFYGLVTLVYIPWAIAMHVALGAFAIPVLFVCCCNSGRQFFLYAYVVLVMLPGKFCWYNLFRQNYRRRKVWDFEMGKPRAQPPATRRRLSVAENIKPQTSQLLTKLPPEVRMLIYKHVIIKEYGWLNICEGTRGPAKGLTQRSDIKTLAYPFITTEAAMGDETLRGLLAQMHRYPMNEPNAKFSIGLPLFQTCRQIYSEGIDQLYKVPTFSFRDVHKPPFFLRSVLPHRLAAIRSIHLVYDQVLMKKAQHVGCSTARFCHRIGECTFCNPIEWLTRIKNQMINLKTIEVFIFVDKDKPVLTLGDMWIARLFDLQVGRNGLRRMKITLPIYDEDDVHTGSNGESEFEKKVKRLKESLQQRLKKQEENYEASRQLRLSGAILGTTPSVQPLPAAHLKDPRGDVEEVGSEVP